MTVDADQLKEIWASITTTAHDRESAAVRDLQEHRAKLEQGILDQVAPCLRQKVQLMLATSIQLAQLEETIRLAREMQKQLSAEQSNAPA